MTHPIRLLTPRGIFRRVDDDWSPRRAIVLDAEGRRQRMAKYAHSPVPAPTHEILPHAVVYAVGGEEDIPQGPCIIYEWMGPSDLFPASALHDATATVLCEDAARIITPESSGNESDPPFRFRVHFHDIPA